MEAISDIWEKHLRFTMLIWKIFFFLYCINSYLKYGTHIYSENLQMLGF